MNVIEPTFELIHPKDHGEGVQKLRFIEMMARISHRSEEAMTNDSWERFITAVVLQHADWSVVEHESATVIFRVDRGVTHELVRHRLFSFTQESTRFVNGRKSYPNGLEFVRPASLPTVQWGSWEQSCYAAEKEYLSMLDYGVRPQEARSILPNSLAATIAVSGNLRNWRHFLLMRTSKETHLDFRRVTVPLLSQFKQRIPLLFDDIFAEEKQSDAQRKPR